MITGAHVMIFTKDEAADRAFLRDVLEIPCIDSGGGWLIFKLPPAELGVHGGEQTASTSFISCATTSTRFVAAWPQGRRNTADRSEESWGRATGVPLPGGGNIGLYRSAPRPA